MATPAAPPATGRSPSKEIAARWPFDGAPDLLVYADAESLLVSGFAQQMVPRVLDLKELPRPAIECTQAVVASTKEMLVGTSGNTKLAILRVEGNAVRDACVPAFEGAKATTVANATAYALPGDNELLAFLPGFVLLGSRAAIEQAATGTGVAPRLTLGTDEHVSAMLRTQGIVVHGALGTSPRRFFVHADVTMHSEEEAVQVERTVAEGRKTLSQRLGTELRLSPGEQQLITRLTNAATLTRDGERLRLKFELDGPAETIANDLAAVAGLAVRSVRQYVVQSKQAEAKNTLVHIGRGLAMWWEREDMDKNGKLVPQSSKKLFSIAPTPKDVPKGTKYQSTREDWKPWRELRFEMTSPQYYQYEIKAAKDGKSADIIARGDLNGNGKPSVFVLHVQRRSTDNMMVVGPSITETDPDE